MSTVNEYTKDLVYEKVIIEYKKSSLVSCMKTWTEARNNDKYMKYQSKLTHQL